MSEPADKECWRPVVEVTGSDQQERRGGKNGGKTFFGLDNGVNGPDVDPATKVGNVAVNDACCLIVEVGDWIIGKTTGAATRGTGKAAAATGISLTGQDKGLSS